MQRSPLDAVLPRLLQRTLEQGKRALVLAGSEDRVENLSSLLWTYDPASWLPHGTLKDGRPEDQPDSAPDGDGTAEFGEFGGSSCRHGASGRYSSVSSRLRDPELLLHY